MGKNMGASKRKISRRIIIVVIALAALVAAGIASWAFLQSSYNAKALSAWEEYCYTTYISPSFPNAGSICSVSTYPIDLPRSFSMSSLAQSGEGGSVSTYYFGINLTAHELVRVSMNSNAPVDFRIYLDNRTGYDTEALANEVQFYGSILANSTGITRYDSQMLSEGAGLYIFELSVKQPVPIATATFDVQRLTS
jgi:hypothetical protein